MIFVHYGSTCFDKEKFREIRNVPFQTKPVGGFWASPVDAKFGWKEWCEAERFREISEDNSFRFTLAENARVLKISSVDDLQSLPKLWAPVSWICLDFELLAKEYDAIWAKVVGWGDLYFQLYGWDCDSVLIMNPNVVIPFDEAD